MNTLFFRQANQETLEMYNRAKEFGIDIHAKRGYTYAGLPYSQHLQMVVNIAIKFRGALLVSDDFFVKILAALWLHDVIEDCGVTYNDLKMNFGVEVADIVWAMSGFGRNRDERNTCVMQKIKGHVIFTFGKLCDKIANYTFGKFVDNTSTMPKKYEKEWAEFEAENYIIDLDKMYKYMRSVIDLK